MASNAPSPRLAGHRQAHRGGARVSRSLLRRSGRLVSRVLNGVATFALVVAVIAFAGLAVGPHLLHYETVTMLTGSMSPTIRPGDIVVDTQEPVSAMRVGQIVSYHIPVYDHHVESHRIVWLKRLPDGSVQFRTKGDANQAPDPWTATSTSPSVWQVRAVVPGVGLAIRDLRQPLVSDALRWGAPGLLVLVLLITIWTRTESDGREDGGGLR